MVQELSEARGADFFISYTAADEAWAQWIAVELERARYTTLIQAFDIRPGSDFVHEMQRAASTSAHTIAVLSPAYLTSAFGEAEWRAAFRADPSGQDGLLLPVRVQPCEPPGLLGSRVYIDLVGVDEATASKRLLDGVARRTVRPTSAPFPGGLPAPSTETGSGAAPGPAPVAPPAPARSARSARPRVQTLWTGGLVDGLQTLEELERSGQVDIAALVDQASFDTHVLRMVRHLLAQRPGATAAPLMEMIRSTPVTGAGWHAARYAAYALTPAHHRYVAEELHGFLRGNVERKRMAMVALGSCAAEDTAFEVAEQALHEPGKLGSWAARGLTLMLLACAVDRLPTTGAVIMNALDSILAVDEFALGTDDNLNSLPVSHAYLLADKWLRAGGNRTVYAAEALGHARATRARRELADHAFRAPERAGTLLKALAMIGGAEAVELLVARLDSRQVGTAAQEALCLCLQDAPGSELDELIDRLLLTELENRWAVFQAIGLCGVSRFIPSLEDGLVSTVAHERGMAALALAEFGRSGTISQIQAAFDEATHPEEILTSGLAVLRLMPTQRVLARIERAAIDARAWALPPAVFSHVARVLTDHGGAYGGRLAQALIWIKSAALPTGVGLPR
jgi:hypothetical protein